MSFDCASDNTREIVAREAARAFPAEVACVELTPAHVAFFQRLIFMGKLTDYPPNTPPPQELLA